MTIQIDFTDMMAPQVPSGVSASEWAALGERFSIEHRAMHADADGDRHGFLELEQQHAMLTQVTAFADAQRARVDDVVVLGIGGSALGAIALRTALGGAEGTRRLHVLDNVDPAPVQALLGRLDAKRTMCCVISKSGTTAETLAQYAIVRAWLQAAGEPPVQHLAFVTDPAQGPLRDLARREQIPVFDIPGNVGGRFSVLTPVGTLPAALAGWDVSALIAGALAMRDRCTTDDLARNPAGLFAMLQWRAQQRAAQGTHVLMPYCDALRDVAPWFVQLWAESLGKVDRDGLNVGPTPLAARGATDQHSLLQLLMEGPADKTVSFIVEREGVADVAIPDSGILAAAPYLRGHTLRELLHAEQRSTASALARGGRPSLAITVTRADAHHMGGLFMLFMIATVYAGALYGVNPLDQPGVELGKELTRTALGSPAEGMAAGDADRARWTV